MYLIHIKCNTHPHNYLIILAEIGIVGFLFYLVFFIFISYNF